MLTVKACASMLLREWALQQGRMSDTNTIVAAASGYSGGSSGGILNGTRVVHAQRCQLVSYRLRLD